MPIVSYFKEPKEPKEPTTKRVAVKKVTTNQEFEMQPLGKSKEAETAPAKAVDAPTLATTSQAKKQPPADVSFALASIKKVADMVRQGK